MSFAESLGADGLVIENYPISIPVFRDITEDNFIYLRWGMLEVVDFIVRDIVEKYYCELYNKLDIVDTTENLNIFLDSAVEYKKHLSNSHSDVIKKSYADAALILGDILAHLEVVLPNREIAWCHMVHWVANKCYVRAVFPCNQ